MTSTLASVEWKADEEHLGSHLDLCLAYSGVREGECVCMCVCVFVNVNVRASVC